MAPPSDRTEAHGTRGNGDPATEAPPARFARRPCRELRRGVRPSRSWAPAQAVVSRARAGRRGPHARPPSPFFLLPPRVSLSSCARPHGGDVLAPRPPGAWAPPPPSVTMALVRDRLSFADLRLAARFLRRVPGHLRRPLTVDRRGDDGPGAPGAARGGLPRTGHAHRLRGPGEPVPPPSAIWPGASAGTWSGSCAAEGVEGALHGPVPSGRLSDGRRVQGSTGSAAGLRDHRDRCGPAPEPPIRDAHADPVRRQRRHREPARLRSGLDSRSGRQYTARPRGPGRPGLGEGASGGSRRARRRSSCASAHSAARSPGGSST